MFISLIFLQETLLSIRIKFLKEKSIISVRRMFLISYQNSAQQALIGLITFFYLSASSSAASS